MRVEYLPTVASKHLDATVHSAVSTVAAMRRRPDVIHYHALGPGLVSPLPRYASRAKVVQTIHGRDDQRAKWGRAAQTVLSTAAWMSGHVPDATITVSRDLRTQYLERYGCRADYVPNGVPVADERPPDLIRERFGLEGGDYVLFVGRLVPEKAPDLLLRAFRDVPGDTRLVVAGGSSFTDDYVSQLEQIAKLDPRVEMAGYVFGDELAELYTNAAAFVLPSDLEGLPLTLLEAASYGVPLIASDIEPHVEVLGESAPGRRIFPRGDQRSLTAALVDVLAARDAETAAARTSRAAVLDHYDWDRATEMTEAVYARVTGTTAATPTRSSSVPKP
jgi:glycosyltransferase involved in cell wall biosynthesis